MAGAERDLLDVTTMKPPQRGVDTAAFVPILTVLCHADAARIGETAQLTELARGQPVSLSRISPLFGLPGGDAGRPLEDPHISRQPLQLVPLEKGAVQLRPPASGMAVSLEGRPVSRPETVDLAALERGVVVELGERVALVLHLAGAASDRQPALGLIGENTRLQLVRSMVRRVAGLDDPVLIRGETGTGKELVARAIALSSARADRPFVAVNLAAISPSTAAAELFGHARGAFTGAVQASPGFFGRAEGGTIFLDEIGQATPEVQGMLLRALEAREIQPLGLLPRRVDVRVVAATDARLEEAIQSGRFMEALLQRLAICLITLPPLRERSDDIGRLLVHFLKDELAKFSAQHRLQLDRLDGQPWLTAPLVSKLARYSWPGNIRELRNVAHQIAIASHDSPQARLDPALARKLESPSPPKPPEEDDLPQGAAARPPSEITEDELESALMRHRWQVGATAAALGVSRTSLYALMEKSARVRKAPDIPTDELRQVQSECRGDLTAMSERLRVSQRALQLRLRQLERERR
jgi:two-component system nitrogen regulation response regulator GlnG